MNDDDPRTVAELAIANGETDLEVLRWNRVLSPEEVREVEDWLRNKWGRDPVWREVPQVVHEAEMNWLREWFAMSDDDSRTVADATWRRCWCYRTGRCLVDCPTAHLPPPVPLTDDNWRRAYTAALEGNR